MRISQFARKYDLSNQELTSFLGSLDSPPKSLHPNAKLNEETIALAMAHFGLQDSSANEETEPTAPQKGEAPDAAAEEVMVQEEPIVEEPIEDSEPVIASPKVAQEEEDPEPSPEEVSGNSEPEVIKEEETILSDELLAMIESEETPAEVDKIKLIKAPKKKLSGLKVLDKIEIPEDPKKKKEAEATKPSIVYTPEEKAERARKREEFKEKKRTEARKKKEAHEARKAKRAKENETKRLKSIKQKHYQQQLSKTAYTPARKKTKKHTNQQVSMQEGTKTKPKTIFGKFWRWLNT